jgi:predicted kinase
MPRLIVLNGLPGTGKSTLAQLYVDDHPLALNLDIDRVRALLGRWPDHRSAAGLLARAIALAAARTHLAAGHDVIIPQLLARPTFLEQAEDLAAGLAVPFHELVLDRPDRHAAWPEYHRDLQATLATRHRARVVPIQPGRVREAYRDVLACLG